MTIDIDKLDFKRRLEFFAVKYFAEQLNKYFNRQLRFDSFADPPEPDVYCFWENNRIGVEVAHLYGSERDARMLFGKSKPEEKTKEHRIIHALVPLNERVISELNFILEKKAQKRYGDRTWLVIRNAYPIWYKEDFEFYKSDILLPNEHSFEEIWLLCDRDGSSGILQLY